jgi:FkbM family methyltransferase
METRNIYLYWINKEYKLISILRNLIYLHSTNGIGYKIHLLTDKNISDYIQDIPDYFSNLCPAHQADFVRINVICDYGGIWLDSDTLVVDSLDSLFDYIETKNGFFIKQNNNIFINGIFGSRSNTPLMIEWKKQMRILLDIKLDKIGWCDIGNDMLQDIYNKNSHLYDNYNIFNGLDNLYPVNWNNCVTEFIDKPYDNYKEIIREYQPLIVLVNSVYKKLEDKTVMEILEGNMPLNYFINKSFENKGIYKNNLYTNQIIYNYGKDDYISKSIIRFKCWEPNISNIFDNIITNNINQQSIILDIGCNIGYYSILSARHTSISKIYSIDGNINNINILKMSCLINEINNIQPINICVSDKVGEFYSQSNSELVKKCGNIGGLSFIKSSQNIIESSEDIISTTIDEIIKINNIIDIIIMKIDIEGGELNALKGTMNTLKTNIIKNIIIEISPKFNNDSIEILQILKDNNYNIFNIPHLETGVYNNDNNYINNICKFPIIDIHNFVKNVGEQTNVLAVKKVNIDKYNKIVIYTDWIESYLTKEPFVFVKNLEMFGWKIIKLSNIDIKNIKNTKCIVLCVTYDDFDISLINSDNVQIIYKIDDIYPYKEIRNKCIQNADIIISPYQYLFNTKEINNMYNNINLHNTFYIPYSAIDDFFQDIKLNNNPINKIFVSGAVSDLYPLRSFICNNIAFKDYIEILTHPSYNNYQHNIVNKLYYTKLNEYLCCFVDTLLYNYILLKVFEICSVGCLLLVEDTIENELNNLGFYDNINCILCNKNNLENKIKWILNAENRHSVDNIRKNGMELVRKNHTTKKRSETFDIIVNNKYIKNNNYMVKFNNNIYFTPDKIQVDYINSGRAEPYSGDITIVNDYINKTKRNNTYLDIGVNIGTHSIVYSKIFNKVLSFEADKYNYNQSKENLMINNIVNVDLFNNALGCVHGFVKTVQHNNQSRGCINTVLTNNETDTEQITLDSLNLNNIDFIKIDVEGNELNVIKGATDTIIRNRPIIQFEYNNLAKNLCNVEYTDIELYLNSIGYIFDKQFAENYYYIPNPTNYKSIFENIYEYKIWNNSNPNIPLSGPGSSLENTKEYSNLLNKFIYDNKCKSVLDLGCGDLTWIPKTEFFNDNDIKYTGVDIVESLITSHLIKFPEKHFLCKDITSYNYFNKVDIIIIRDVIFHLKNNDILSIFDNIKNKFQFIIITSCNNHVNTDNFNKWHFTEKNILIKPFNKLENFLIKIEEPVFNRNAFIYSHDSFYNL